MFVKYIKKVIDGYNLTEEEMEKVMINIMKGNLSNSLLAGFLVALRIKGETISEITGAARVMRQMAVNISCDKKLIDTCGTGGDGSDSFNISTASALILAAGNYTVAKHGNRSVSSKCGSADVLEALGINLELTPAQVETCLKETGMGFLYAPVFHKAMKHAVTARKELGIRTIFNILGPLTNPAKAEYQVLGVFDSRLVLPMAEVLKNLKVKRAMVVHGAGGLDEFSLAGKNKVAFLKNNNISIETITPEDAGLKKAKLEDIKGGNPQENKDIILNIFKGKKGPERNIVLLNTAAAIIVYGDTDNWKEAVKIADDIIKSGRVLKKIDELKEFTNLKEVII